MGKADHEREEHREYGRKQSIEPQEQLVEGKECDTEGVEGHGNQEPRSVPAYF
jgi:hypothetical protein